MLPKYDVSVQVSLPHPLSRTLGMGTISVQVTVRGDEYDLIANEASIRAHALMLEQMQAFTTELLQTEGVGTDDGQTVS